MAIEDVASNLSSSLPQLESSLVSLITIFKVIGGIIGIYIIYWIIASFINARKLNVLSKMLTHLESIDKKLGKSKK